MITYINFKFTINITTNTLNPCSNTCMAILKRSFLPKEIWYVWRTVSHFGKKGNLKILDDVTFIKCRVYIILFLHRYMLQCDIKPIQKLTFPHPTLGEIVRKCFSKFVFFSKIRKKWEFFSKNSWLKIAHFYDVWIKKQILRRNLLIFTYYL